MKHNRVISFFSRSHSYLWILLAGALSGTAITLLAWLQKWTPLVAPHWLYVASFWISVLAVILLGMILKYRHIHLSRIWVVLSIGAAIGLTWLFPETLAPGCDGMPRVLAHWEEECTTTCTTVCTWWVPLSNPTCAAQPHQPWDLGCCWSYGESCSTSCSNTWVDDPPAIDGSVSCATPGNNGWCRGGATLDLITSDPQGYAVTVTGDINGSPFTCSGTCSQTLPEGSGIATFSVLAIGGGNLSSPTGSTSYQVDSTAPSISLSLPTPDGMNGWFTSSPVIASASAADNISGLASVSINGGSDSFTASSDGIYPLTAIAGDNAGNLATTSGMIQIDSIPPTLSISVPAPDGNNGWYTSPLVVTAIADDVTSGVAGVQVRLDGGTWQDDNQVNVTIDGVHLIEFQAWDQAGNLTSNTQVFQVDTLPPQSMFTFPAEGSTNIVSGSITFSGISQDPSSGIDAVQISLDEGQTWQDLTPDSTGQWSYRWDTSVIPNGTYTIFARGQDLAGNQEHTAQVTVVVSNEPPEVSITHFFSIWQTATISITSHTAPIGGARLTISDPQNRWPAYVQEFPTGALPQTFRWDRRFGDGSIAPPGDYPVILDAWDIYGNMGQDQGWVSVFLPAESTPTQSRTISVTPTSTPDGDTFSPQPTAGISLPIQESTPEPLTTRSHSYMIWSVIGLIGLLAVLTSASLSDPRPKAIGRLKKTLASIQGKSK